MAAERRKGEENPKTRDAILDATETIMLEEGYAAVTSRRVAAVAGLKSQLVYYHFRTMDALFLALFERAEAKYFAQHLQALTSADPVRALWDLSLQQRGAKLIQEYVALAKHRKVVQKELARASERLRNVEIAMLSRTLEERGFDQDDLPPIVLSVLIAGLTRIMVNEGEIGVTLGHAETRAYVERRLTEWATRRARDDTRATAS